MISLLFVHSSCIFHIYLIVSDDEWQKLDDMGALIEKLLIAQNQTLSKLSQLIHILQRMINATDTGNVVFYGNSQPNRVSF